MPGNALTNESFSQYENELEVDAEIREGIKKICDETDKISREITIALQVIHRNEVTISSACQKARQFFDAAREGYQKLKDAVPKAYYFKYQDSWRWLTQKYCYLISLTIWLEAGILARHQTIAEILGSDVKEKIEGFHIDIEDYLMGLLMLCTELTRFAVNSASQGEFCRVEQISKFVMEVNAGFRLLNLKNDNLRKRYDGLKFDVKKIEEIVYDLRLRAFIEYIPPPGDIIDNDNDDDSEELF